MPIAFDPPAHAPHGTLPTHGARGADDDPSTLDMFTQLLLAAANVQDAAAPLESTSGAAADCAQTPDASTLGFLPLPMTAGSPVPGAGTAAGPVVTIVAREKVADVRAASPRDARALLDGQARDAQAGSIVPVRRDAGEIAASDLSARNALAGRTSASTASSLLGASPAAAVSLPDPSASESAPAHAGAGAASAAATLATLLAPALAAADKATAVHAAADLPAPGQAQVVAAPPSLPAPVIHVETISAPAFTPGWQDETVSKLAQIVLTRTERAELKLHPAELGPVNVRIEMRADQASIQIVAASPETRSALEQSLPQLRDLLAGQGITLGQASVHDNAAQRDARPDAWAASPRTDGRDDPAAAPASDAVRLTLRTDRLVDVFA